MPYGLTDSERDDGLRWGIDRISPEGLPFWVMSREEYNCVFGSWSEDGCESLGKEPSHADYQEVVYAHMDAGKHYPKTIEDAVTELNDRGFKCSAESLMALTKTKEDRLGPIDGLWHSCDIDDAAEELYKSGCVTDEAIQCKQLNISLAQKNVALQEAHFSYQKEPENLTMHVIDYGCGLAEGGPAVWVTFEPRQEGQEGIKPNHPVAFVKEALHV